jgi:hypothetical protein
MKKIMTTEIKTNNGITKELITNLVLHGDISKMSDEMKVQYYNQLCHSLNLNPVTKPFQIISFQGKSLLYATKDATEQLRKLNGVSVVEMTQEFQNELCITKCKVQDASGRFDIATGATNIAGLKGDALANSIMKSETKAKRRATLSICGLGILDETELDTMPTYETADIKPVQIEKTTNENPYIQIKRVKTKEGLQKLWSDNKSLQSDEKFRKLKDEMKAKLELENSALPEILK